VTLAYRREDRSADVGGYAYKANMVYLGLSYGPPKRMVAFQPPSQASSGGAGP
jgi:hypothetical protein